MSTSTKPRVGIPAITNVTGPYAQGEGGWYNTMKMQLLHGTFTHKDARGRIKGLVLVRGNVCDLHTCCGGAVATALRSDYVKIYSDDNWYRECGVLPLLHQIQDKNKEPISTLPHVWFHRNPDVLPCLNDFVVGENNNVADWTDEQAQAWGEVVLCAGLRSWMRARRRTTCLAVDRKNGVTYHTLRNMEHTRDLLKDNCVLVGVFYGNGRHKSVDIHTPYEAAWSQYRQNNGAPRNREFASAFDLVVYKGNTCTNINGGATLYSLSITTRNNERGHPPKIVARPPELPFIPVDVDGDTLDNYSARMHNSIVPLTTPNQSSYA